LFLPQATTVLHFPGSGRSPQWANGSLSAPGENVEAVSVNDFNTITTTFKILQACLPSMDYPQDCRTEFKWRVLCRG